MQFLEPTVTLVTQVPGIDGMLRHVELAGRVPCKSEDGVTEDSYVEFVDTLKKEGRMSPLEHGSVYLSLPASETGLIDKFKRDPHSFTLPGDDTGVVTNYRVVQESFDDSVLEYWNEDVGKTLPRLTLCIRCSRAVGLGLARHRAFSLTQESTRHCDYSKDRFGGKISCIIPSWIKDLRDGDEFTLADIEAAAVVRTLLEHKRSEKTMMLVSNHVCAENIYMQMLGLGCTPQQAREVLPGGLKTEVMMTGTIGQWKEFLALRSPAFGAVGVHPDMAVIADKVYETLREFEYLPKIAENDKDD